MRSFDRCHASVRFLLCLAATVAGCSDDDRPRGDRSIGGGAQGGDLDGGAGGLAGGGPAALSDLGDDGRNGPPAGLGAPSDDGVAPDDGAEQDPKGLPDGEGDGPDADGAPADLRSLVVIGGQDIELTAMEEASVRALLINGLGEPVAGELVGFAIQGEGADSSVAVAGGRPAARVNSRTNGQGHAVAKLTAGRRTARFTLRVTHPRAEAIDLAVDVTAVPKGDLAVAVRVPAAGEGGRAGAGIWEVQVTLSPALDRDDAGGCPIVDGRADAGAGRERVVDRAGAAAPVQFRDLPQAAHYRVEAVGRTAAGAEIARGCARGGPIRGLETVDVSVTLALAPVRFLGDPVRFDQESEMALLDGLSESLRAHLEELSVALAEPASFFVRPITDAVPLDLGAPLLPPGFARQAINMAAGWALEEYFRENVGDPAYERFDLAADELLDILTAVGVRSQLTLANTAAAALRAGETLDGTTRWGALILTSPLFCHPAPPAPDCETVVIPLEGRAKLGVQASFTAGWDVASGAYQTEDYAIALDFRELFHVIFKQTILPAILDDPDATTVALVMERLANCDRIGRLMVTALGDPVLELLLSPLAADFCRQGIYGFAEDIDAEIDALDGVSSALHLRESALLADLDGDRLLETLADGSQSLHWSWAADPAGDGVVDGTEFQGAFTARVPAP